MSTILDPSQLDFTVNRDQIYYSSKEEKENLKDESSRGKLEQVLDHMFANARGHSRLLNWFHPHAVTYVCETVSAEMDAMKEDLWGMLDSVTPEFLSTWDLDSMMRDTVVPKVPVLQSILCHAAQTDHAVAKNKIKDCSTV
jgi:hypothetical protein